MGRPKKEQTTEIKAEDNISKEDLIKILMPFAMWAWDDKVKAEAVIDKYFKQTGK